MTASETSDKDDVLFREVTHRFWLLTLVTEVRVDGIYVRLEPLQRSFRRIPAAQIQNVRLITYSATTYGGWHWGLRRTLSGDTVYRLRGSRGVEITHADGNRWFIGSQRPKEFTATIKQVSTEDE